MTNIANIRNTEQNQSQTQLPILIAVDHGYGNIKTEHTVFPAGVTPCESEPMFANDKLCWAGRWYIIGEGHKEFIDNKTADEDYLLLTMAAIAKELKLRRRAEAAVYLAAGLPLTWYGQQKESFRKYLTRLPVLEFSFGGTAYTVREAVNRELHIPLDDLIIEEMLRTGSADVSERVAQVMRRAMRDYAGRVMKTLREHGYEPETTKLYIMGGGGCILKNFGQYDAKRVFFLNDIHATAKGYRRMAERALQAKGIRCE